MRIGYEKPYRESLSKAELVKGVTTSIDPTIPQTAERLIDNIVM